jgi:hypothetical protein
LYLYNCVNRVFQYVITISVLVHLIYTFCIAGGYEGEPKHHGPKRQDLGFGVAI